MIYSNSCKENDKKKLKWLKSRFIIWETEWYNFKAANNNKRKMGEMNPSEKNFLGPSKSGRVHDSKES